MRPVRTIAAAVMTLAFASISASAHAVDDDPQAPDVPETCAHEIQVIFDRLWIHNDGDWGAQEGEVDIRARVGLSQTWLKVAPWGKYTSQYPTSVPSISNSVTAQSLSDTGYPYYYTFEANKSIVPYEGKAGVGIQLEVRESDVSQKQAISEYNASMQQLSFPSPNTTKSFKWTGGNYELMSLDGAPVTGDKVNATIDGRIRHVC